MKKVFLCTIALILILSEAVAQEWVVPDNRKGRLSPFPFTEDTKRSGENFYAANCRSCHGNPGRGDVISMTPPPPDPGSEKFQSNSDGEMFFKISEGRQLMPSFKNVFTSNDIWHIVSFLRSFNRGYRQKVSPLITSSAYPGSEIRLRLAYFPADTAIELTATAVSPGATVPVKDAAVRLFTRRTFGMMPVGDEEYTGTSGSARFRIPEGLSGDSSGMVQFVARFSDEDSFGSAGVDTMLAAGEKVVPVSLRANRAMWNSARMAPFWIIITFCAGLLTVWGIIFLILLKVRDIYIIGETLTDGQGNIK
jgi:hypothetical protein